MKQFVKHVYSLLPFKKQLFSLIRLFNPPASIYQHLYFKGIFKVHVGNRFFKIRHYGYELENDLFWHGYKSWERVSTSLWSELSKTSSIIIDVGANTGVYALIAGAANPNAKVFAFEPLKNVFKRLRANLEINDLPITAYEIAISNQNGYTSFYTDDENHSYDASLNKQHRPDSGKEVRVQTMTLDSFIEKNNLKVDLIKIDVERHEPELIEGFIESIKKYRPTIIIEILDDSIGRRVNGLLKDIPYFCFSLNEQAGIVRKMDRIDRGDEFNVLLCTEAVAKQLNLLGKEEMVIR